MRIALAIIMLSFTCHSYGQELYKTMVWDIYLEQQPKTLEDEVVDAFRSEEGSFIIGTVAALYGVPPEFIGTLSYAANRVSVDGEESRTRIDFEEGYYFCNYNYKPISEIGRGALTITAGANRLLFYSWLQKGRLGQGRTIIEGELTVIAKRPSIPGRGSIDCISTPQEIVTRNWKTR